MNLSPNFSLAELIQSDTAARRGISNDPPAELYGNGKKLADMLEKVRAILGVPVIVTSAYRGLELNAAIGSRSSSDHVKFLAADFKAPKFGTPFEICQALKDKQTEIGFTQLIYEFGSWVHIACGNEKTVNNVVLTINTKGVFTGIQEA